MHLTLKYLTFEKARQKISINLKLRKLSTMQVTHLSLNAFRGEIFIATAFLTKRHLSNIILKLSVRELHNHNKHPI